MNKTDISNKLYISLTEIKDQVFITNIIILLTHTLFLLKYLN